MDLELFDNPCVSALPPEAVPTRAPLNFHRRLPGYAPTPLVEAPELAQVLGVGEVWVKDESARLGLPSFKILGASWAVYRTLTQRMGRTIEPWTTVEDLAARLLPRRPLTLAAATDGNHGRAVARMAALLGFDARIFVPAGTAEPRIRAIESEGAQVIVVDGTYDDAVRRSAAEADERCLVISDTSWPGYEDVPRWVIEGYSTIFWEVDDAVVAKGRSGPDVVVVQIGVGALAAAVVRHYRHEAITRQPRIVGVEPLTAACLLRSMQAGRIVEVPGPHTSIMAGLNCGRASLIAWPIVCSGIDVFVAIHDDAARQAMRALYATDIVAGETGAAGLGGLMALLASSKAETTRSRLGIDGSSRVLLISTEGATDPASYQRIVGRLQSYGHPQ